MDDVIADSARVRFLPSG